MIKVLYFLKRIPGITHAQFREHYENSHVKMAQKYLGHLMIGYERNYCTQVRASRSLGRTPAAWDYDCIAEWLLPNEEALEEVYRIFKDPEIGKEFYDDEGRFLDRDAVLSITCRDHDVINTGTGGGHGTLERKARAS
jgi:hypothetical protein